MRKRWGHRWFATTFTVVMFLLLLMPSVQADQQKLKLENLQRTLKQSGAGWTAGENEISRLSEQDFQKLLGLDMDAAPLFRGPGDPVIDENSYKLALPATHDWRDYKGSNYVTSVKRQQCGDCWAHSAAGALEARLMIDGQDALDLSEQLMVSSCYSGGSCGGGSIMGTSRFLRDVGIPEEDCYPYLGRDSSCSQACNGWKNITYRTTTVTAVAQNVEALKTAVYTRGPVNVGYMVYSDHSKYRGGIYKKTDGATRQGGHGVVLVGYNDNDQCFIVKNSWGTGWGEDGYFRIAYSQVYNEVGFGMSAAVLGEEIDHSDNEDDQTPPTPSPMAWKSAPAATGSKAITMTAETASDSSGVSYFFECVSGDCNDSGWQDSPTYTDSGLKPLTTYAYRVKARDKSPQSNETEWSPQAEATTLDAKAAIEMISPFSSGLSHSVPQGSNRLLVLTVHAEDDNTDVSATSVTYGGQPMTLAVEQHVASGYHAYVAVFVLGEEGIAKASGGDFNVTWNETPARAPGYASAVFSNVDPSTPVSAKDGAGGTGNPLSTPPLATTAGDMVLVAATCGNTGTYDVTGAFSKAMELDIPSSDAVIGYLPADGQPATAGVSHSNANRQAAVGLVLSLAGDTPPPPEPEPEPEPEPDPDPQPTGGDDVEILGDWQSGTQHTVADGSNRLLVFTVHAEDNDTDVIAASVMYGGQEMQKITETHISDSYHAYSAVFVLNEAGIAAASDGDFTVEWSQTPFRTPGYTSVCLGNVDQDSPIGAFDGASGTSASIATPALENKAGDLVILAGTCGNIGDYTLDNGFTKSVELTIPSSDGVAGYKQCTGESEIAAVQHSRVNRQALAAVVVSAQLK